MANGFSSPRPTEVVIGEDNTAEQMLLSLGGTILRGVISDAFSTVRKEQSNKYATLWEAQELRTKSILALTNPAEVENAIVRFKEDYNDINVPESQKEGLRALASSLEEHHTHLLKKEPSMEVARTIGTWEETITEAQQENSNLNNDPKFLSEVLLQMEDDMTYHTDRYVERFAGTDTPIVFPDESKTPDAKMRFLSQYIKSKPDGDRLLASQFEIFAKEHQMIDQQLSFASEQLAINTSINQYGLRLDELRGDKKVYDAESIDLLLELSESLTDKGQYMTEAHHREISNMYEEKRLMVSAVKSLDEIQNIYEGGTVTADAAKFFLDDAKSLISIGYETERKDLIAQGLGLLDNARRAEISHQKGLVQAEIATGVQMTKEKTKFTQSTKAKMMPIMKSISQKLSPKMIEEKLSSSYGPRGEHTLIPKTEQYLQSFSLETDANLKSYKSEIGIEIAKLVKSSDLDGLDDNTQKIVNDLANEARNGNFEASDKLYEILHVESKDLDFKGTDDVVGKDKLDTNAKEIFEQYLKLYGILYDANIDAIARFGADYGYAQIQRASAMRTATDEDEGLRQLLNLNP